MLLLEHLKKEHLNSIVDLVASNKDILVPNNFMIYYLSCTVFYEFSFVALEEDVPVGVIISFCNLKEKSIWIHQLSVDPNHSQKGIGTRLLKKLENSLKENEIKFNKIKLAVKKDNLQAKNFYLKNGYQFVDFEQSLKMEIYEKY